MADPYWPQIFGNPAAQNSRLPPANPPSIPPPPALPVFSNEQSRSTKPELASTSLDMSTPTSQKPSSLTRIMTNSCDLARLRLPSGRQNSSTASTSRSSIDAGGPFDYSPLGFSTGSSSAVENSYNTTSNATRGRVDQGNGATSYPNQLRIILSGKNLDRETVAGSFHNQKEPTFNITRGRYRNHENNNAMPSTAVQYHATERMMSPLAASRHQQLPRFGWENANERGAFDMQALTRSLPQQHQRNARSMPTIKESAAGVMNGFSGSFGDFATDNRRASFLAEGYNMHSGYRPVEWNKFDSMNTSQTMAHDTTINNSADHGQNYGGFNSVSLPYQPSHAMPWAAQSPSQPQATNSPYGLSTMAMAQGTGPLASMVMSSPALKPSNMLQREQGILPPLTEGPNGNDGPLTKTREEEEVPNEENCSLWIKNIAPTMTPRLFFQMIRCGAVYALHIYPPTGQHTTQAAKLIFKRPSSAAAFLQQANTAAGMRPHGRRLKVNYNRNGVREYVGSKTRVIRILGPSREMLFPVWDAYFRGLCLFDYDDVLDPGCDIGGKAIIEFRFMRIDAQSQMIHKEITDNPQLQRFRAYFAPDPCGN